MILVTGSEGYIGSILMMYLESIGKDVIGIDNFSNSFIATTGSYTENLDICDYDALHSFFKKNDIQAIVHLAGKKYIKESFTDPGGYHKNNVLGTVNLLEMAMKFKVESFIFASSLSVIERKTNPYSNSKRHAGHLVKALNIPNTLVLYLPNIIGGYQGVLGDRPAQTNNLNIFPLIHEIIRGRKDPLVFDQDTIRSYMDVFTLIQNIVKYLNEKQTVKDVIYNTNNNCDLRLLCHAIEEVTSYKIPLAKEGKPYDRDNQHFKDIMGYFYPSIKSSFEFYDYAEKWYIP